MRAYLPDAGRKACIRFSYLDTAHPCVCSAGRVLDVDARLRFRQNRASGPVAQLGARFHGMEEVIGSIPIRSTK